MKGRPKGLFGLSILLLGVAPAAVAAELDPNTGYGLVTELLQDDRGAREKAARQLIEATDRSLVPAVVDTLFFMPRQRRTQAVEVLRSLTGADLGAEYWQWVEWVGAHPEIEPKPGYLQFKSILLGSRIDPSYRKLFYQGAPTRIRLEEVVWGGVRVDGIPSLEQPDHVPADEAGYLADTDKVFGVSVGGEHRAYPVKVVSWHEMANDVVGGQPVTLSFCTLCGSAILYSTKVSSGETYTFGTSGLLYRSNKLMYDRQSWSLWSNLTGKPVVGRLVLSPVELEVLPITLTTWGAWRREHPETSVLALDGELKKLAREHGFRYQTGAADQARQGVSFPVWQRSDALPEKEEIYAVRVNGHAKAYPLRAVLAERVVNDRLGGTALVLVANPESGAVRAYERGAHTFSIDPDGALLDEADRVWRVTETELVPPDGAEDGLSPLPRVPGHVAFWFGWYAFYPESEVYRR